MTSISRLKSLDRLFLALLFAVSLFVVVLTSITERYLVNRSLKSTVSQLTKSSQLLALSVKTELDSGNLRYAWDILNQSVGHSGLVGFLIFDGSGKIAIDDQDFFESYQKTLSSSQWQNETASEAGTYRLSRNGSLLQIRQNVTSNFGGTQFYIQFLYDFQDSKGSIQVVQVLVVGVFALILFMTVGSFLVLRRTFLRSIQMIATGVSEILIGAEPQPKAINLLTEYFPAEIHIRNFRQEFLRAQQDLQEQTRLAVMAQVARQVSHDIRSPLSALNMVIGTLQSLTEEKRLLIRNATQRINDIANQLLQKSKSDQVANAEQSSIDTTEPVMLVSLLDAVVSEKRVHFRERMEIEIQANLAHGYGLFSNIPASDFARAISNLINNSVEACTGPGRVTLELNNNDRHAIIKIRDNGKGIPPDLLQNLGRKGLTYGKDNHESSGSGLGVYHAIQTVNAAGGHLTIESELGHGTTVSISLPNAQAPWWFVKSLKLVRNQFVVSLDDDQTIHQIWNGRLKSIVPADYGIQHLSFSSIETFDGWLKLNLDANALSLIDYEFINQKSNGLEVIERLGIAKQSVLVTSRFEEQHIRSHAASLEVKILPKSLAPFVPIEFEMSRLRFDAVLIDDDPLMHLTWSTSATDAGKHIACFSTPEDFFAASGGIDLSCPLFIDVSLANGVRGEDIANQVASLGFKNISLATGYDASSLHPPSSVKRIVGKDPLFD